MSSHPTMQSYSEALTGGGGGDKGEGVTLKGSQHLKEMTIVTIMLTMIIIV